MVDNLKLVHPRNRPRQHLKPLPLLLRLMSMRPLPLQHHLPPHDPLGVSFVPHSEHLD